MFMDIFGDIASVTRRIDEITGQTAAPTPAGGQSTAFSGMVNAAMNDQAPLQPTQGPNVIPPPQIQRLVDVNAATFSVDPALIKAIIANESGFDANATSKTGAQGLMHSSPKRPAAWV